VGLLVSAVFAAGSAFVAVRPEIAPLVIRHRKLLRIAVVIAMAAWFVWTVAKLPLLHRPGSEAATGTLLALMAIVERSSTASALRGTGASSTAAGRCSLRPSSPVFYCCPRR
jgi:hypothetical protein